VSPEAYGDGRFTVTPARGDGRSLAPAGDKLSIDGRDLVAKVVDENVELTEIVIVRTSSLHAVRALVL
jgi:hypothetical protein